jgi:hypothetical protein
MRPIDYNNFCNIRFTIHKNIDYTVAYGTTLSYMFCLIFAFHYIEIYL